MRNKFLTTEQAAEEIGISRQSVVDAIQRGDMQADSVGRAYIIPRVEVEKYKRNRPKAGWPKGKKRKKQ